MLSKNCPKGRAHGSFELCKICMIASQYSFSGLTVFGYVEFEPKSTSVTDVEKLRLKTGQQILGGRGDIFMKYTIMVERSR